jgi:hypothetical protein
MPHYDQNEKEKEIAPPNTDEKESATKCYDVNTSVNIMRFIVTSLNFLMSILFALILLIQAFTMDGITGTQIFHADRVLQTSGLDNFPAPSLSTFIKQAYGADTEIIGMVDKTSLLDKKLPTMYEVAGSNSILRLEAVHCSFMLFSALWISSAFSLAMIQLPGYEPMYWSHIRVVIVHVWNFTGLIATGIIFSATTKWASIPTSNLFYALVGQAMAWMYQYFHMVECTQLVNGNLEMKYVSVSKLHQHTHITHKQFSTELRKFMYMELSVVAPMMMVAGIMPGAIGIDEWRVQTILFSSWILFALLGLHLRFRKSVDLGHGAVHGPHNRDEVGEIDPYNKLHPRGLMTGKNSLDALGYLTYAIVIVFLMLVNAIEPIIFYDPPYATERVTQCRWGSRVLFLVSGCFVLEILLKTIQLRFLPGKQPFYVAQMDQLPSFIANFIYIAFGSFLVKVLLFSGISDVNGLSMAFV